MANATAIHLTARELAALRLPGLPGTKREIARRADQQGWPFVPGPRGAKLIDVAKLPDHLRAAIEARFAPLVRPANANEVRRGKGRPSGTDYFTRNPRVANAVEAIVARQQLSATRIMELLTHDFATLPEIGTLRRFLRKLEATRKPLLDSFRDPDLYKSRHRLALGRADGGVTHANQVWELDTTKADVLCRDGRRQVIGLIDVYSRRARFILAKSESGQSVRRLLIDTIADWGLLPDQVKTDNGSGFINASIVSALGALGIDHHRVAPGSGEKKPHIERVFGTLTRERFELLPGYAGHSVADAQKLRGRAKKETGRAIVLPELDEAELSQIVTSWCEGIYNLRPHGATGMSPITRWLSTPGMAARAPDRDALMIALSARVGTQVVGKKGIRWKRGIYWSNALVPFIGRPVEVRRDEEDLGALFIFDEAGRYIDTAVNFIRAGLSEEAFAAAASSHQRAHMKEARADIRDKMRAFDIDRARDAILRRDAAAAGKLVTLPVRGSIRETPLLDSFNADATPLPYEQRAPDQAAIAERVERAETLIAQAEDGHAVDPQRLAWARAFVAGPTFRTFKAIAALSSGRTQGASA